MYKEFIRFFATVGIVGRSCAFLYVIAKLTIIFKTPIIINPFIMLLVTIKTNHHVQYEIFEIFGSQINKHTQEN